MNWPEIIPSLLTSLLGGGIVAAVLTFLINRQKESRADKDSALQRAERLLDRMEREAKEREEKYERLEKAFETAQKDLDFANRQLLMFQSSHLNMPFPVWMKEPKGKMIFVNSVYEEEFLLPQGKTAEDYIGATDEEIWGEVLGRLYWQNDKKAIRSPRGVWTGREKIIIPNHEDVSKHWRTVKYPQFMNGKLVGITGMCIPDFSDD